MRLADNETVAMGDPLRQAVQRLLLELPAFAASPFASANEIDFENAYMVFEAFTRYLLASLRAGKDAEAKAGFRLVNELSRSKGEVSNLLAVSVLERLASDASARADSRAMLEGDARREFESLVAKGE
jgi:hypothetical protein